MDPKEERGKRRGEEDEMGKKKEKNYFFPLLSVAEEF
jgi:hypothetical protein